MINRSLLNIGLYIQPHETCFGFSCPLIFRLLHVLPICLNLSSIFMSVNSVPEQLVRQFHVCQVMNLSWTGIWMMVRHFHVRHFQRPRPSSEPAGLSRNDGKRPDGVTSLLCFCVTLSCVNKEYQKLNL